MLRFSSILAVFVLASVWCFAAVPAGSNLGFENGNTGWTFQLAGIESGPCYEGTHYADLRNGYIEQTFTGLTPGATHTLRLACLSQAPNGELHHAEILIDGVVIAGLHLGRASSGEVNEYLSANAFEFIPAKASVTLRIRSLQSGSAGLMIDAVRIDAGPAPAPPAAAWSSLTTVADSRGGRRLVNGSFESAIVSPASSPDNCGPAGNDHLSGLALPGWRVTRGNVDVIQYDNALAPDGANALDTNGHGPGGIAQTITGLSPGAVYTFSLLHARHIYWGTAPMTGEVWANGRKVASLVRTINQGWDDGYGLAEVPVLASASGSLTLEIRSTINDQGGSILYDDLRLKEGGNAFLAWSLHHGVTADPQADDDRDGVVNAVEFLLRGDPRSRTVLPLIQGNQIQVPLSGLARAAGFTDVLKTSRTLGTWVNAGTPGCGVSLISDSSAPGADGVRVYQIAPGERRMFWRHEVTAP
ncbi:hypothetical protein [Luteolibacter soli]|uniref:Uncharacterized protein n=1 Tax=Luteolibacter soli TaxID=3135280 RepID=A0ABU9B1E9_9BACT